VTDPLRVVVGVYVARGPMGGLSWHYLHYAAALVELGHHVTVLEDSGDHEWCCYHPATGENDADPRDGLRYADDCYTRLGLGDRWAYYDAHTSTWHGSVAETVAAELSQADVFLNISGATVVRPWWTSIPHRVLIDTDPGFTQVRHLTEPVERALAEAHTDYFTFGERFGQPGCLLPDDGFAWRPTRQPLALQCWPVRPPSGDRVFTTVMRWDSYYTRRHGDLELGMKSRSFEPYVDLPADSPVQLEIALGGPAPEEELRSHGWRIRDPFEVTPDPWAMQDYVAGSTAEFTVAKHGYVSTRSGWFSERSANYLLSGRAVITQDTGFASGLPVGSGLLAFSTRDEALACIEAVLARPAEHGAAAREIAVQHFDGRRLLDDLLCQVMNE
jgi:hypothetical protein